MANQLDFRVKNGLIVGGNANIAGAITSVDSIQLDTALAYSAPAQGQVRWNADEGSLDVGLGNGVVANLPEETLYRVTNNTASTIPDGTLVAANGTTGNSGKILVAPWDPSVHTPVQIMGIATSNIASGSDGHVTHFGKVRGIQTNGGNYGEVWINGDIIYAKPGGGLTKTIPTAPNTKTIVAIVISAHASNGTLFVRPTLSSSLGNDDLVQLNGLANGDLLVYNGTAGRFENKASLVNLTLTGELRGPSNLIIDPSAVGDNTGTVTIKGDLVVEGATTTINSTSLSVKDKNIVIASGAANAAAADGAGITIDGAGLNLTYEAVGDLLKLNKSLNITTAVDEVGLSIISNIGSNSSAVRILSDAGGYGRMEFGGNNGAYLDFKTPDTDDYDLRIIVDATSNKIITNGQLTIENINGGTVVYNSSSSDALRVVQAGSGNSFVVHDAVSDTTPFVIDSAGNIGIGLTTPGNHVTGGIVMKSATAFSPQIQMWNETNNGNGTFFLFRKDRAGASVQSGDNLSTIAWQAFDGTAYLTGAAIQANVDGTPGTNDMPTRLVFSTAADGSSSVSERMRIDNAGRVGIGAIPADSGTLFISGSPVATYTYNVNNLLTIGRTVVNEAVGYISNVTTAASAFSLTTLQHYRVTQGTIGAGSIVVAQNGFLVDAAAVGATYNYGFASNINEQPAGPLVGNTIASISSSGTTVTITTVADHGLTNGQVVTIAATANASALLNGVPCTVLVPGSTNFTLIGAADNNAGTSFVSTGTGGGNGTVTLNQQNSGKAITVTGARTFTYTSALSATFSTIAATGTITPTQRWNFFASGSAPNYFAGNVGIGVTQPSVKLQVSGTSTELLRLTDGTRTLYAGCDANEPWFGTSSNNALRLATNGTEKARITSAGNVGIGTGTPQEKLDVRGNLAIGNSASSNYITFRGTTGDEGYTHTYIGERIYSGAELSELLLFKGNDPIAASGPDRIRMLAGDIVFDTYTGVALSGSFDTVGATTSGVNTRMIVKSDGKIGIGTSNPQRRLHVSNGIVAPTGTLIEKTALLLTNGDTTGTLSAPNSVAIQFAYDPANPRAFIEAGTYGNDFIKFGFATSEYMRMDAAGKLLIGFSESKASGHRVQIKDAIDALAGSSTSGADIGAYTHNALDLPQTWTSTRILQHGTAETGAAQFNVNLNNANLGELVHVNGSGLHIATNNAAPIIITTTSTERIRITAGGNVGINTLTPQAHLDLNGILTHSHTFPSKAYVAGNWYRFLTLNASNAGQSVTVILRNPGGHDSVEIKLSKHTTGKSNLGYIAEVRRLGSYAYTYNMVKVRVCDDSVNQATHLEVQFGTGIGTTDMQMFITGAMRNGWFSIVNMADGASGLGTTKEIIISDGIDGSDNQTVLGLSTRARDLIYVKGNGNIGIGGQSPVFPLHVTTANDYATAMFEASGFEANVGLKATSTNGRDWRLVSGGGGGGFSGGKFGVFDNTAAAIRMVIDSSGNVGINTASPTYRLHVNGSFAATTKSFVIDHPTKPGKKLRHGSLEGPENGVYVRGKLIGSNKIELPEYWTKLVDPDSITVNLTPIGAHQNLYVADIVDNTVYVDGSDDIKCFYTVYAERIDVEKLDVEIDV